MAINKFMTAALKALSYSDIDVKQNYKVDRTIKTLTHPAIKALNRTADFTIDEGGVPLECGVFLPDRFITSEIMLFFHGGGWVSGDIDTYSTVCRALAHSSGRLVVSVDYRRAPEHRFPTAVEDCYAAARALLRGKTMLRVNEEDVTLIGDSAGGNIAAAVSLMAADRGEFKVHRQILIYPSTYNDHSEASPFESIRTNGEDYLLTSKKICDYMSLYMSGPDDLDNPYFAPLLSDKLAGQPRTLIITAEYDPLRDEGEAYADKLRESGVHAENYRIPDALHGFFSLPARFAQVQTAHNLIRTFMDKGL